VLKGKSGSTKCWLVSCSATESKNPHRTLEKNRGSWADLCYTRHRRQTVENGSRKKNEAVALRHAADALKEHKSHAKDKVVIFTDALSVVTALKCQHSNARSELTDSLKSLTKCFQKVVIQWGPVQCEIAGNEKADKLAKPGGAPQQEDLGTTYEVTKTN
jgi:ribonuclease HI